MLNLTRSLRVLPTSLLLLLTLSSECLADPDPSAAAEPEALPVPAPVPEANPLPIPIAAPEAKAEAQSGNGNVYQFSGAIYINGNGGTYSSAGGSYQSATPAQCPNSAPISCTNLGEPDWYVVLSRIHAQKPTAHFNSGAVRLAILVVGLQIRSSGAVLAARHVLVQSEATTKEGEFKQRFSIQVLKLITGV
ncbi:MAG: hypothetical protein Q9165_003294 [Trypethelium subeluteriae]